MSILYKTIIRPVLEYGHSIVYPKYEKDRILVENVQRRATKMIPEIKDLPYTQRLESLDLPSLQYRRDRGDMVECYKFTHEDYNSTFPFLMKSSTMPKTRGHSLRFVKRDCKLDVRQKFFTNRVVNLWNSLPESVVTAPTLDTFKNRLDRSWKKHWFSLEPVPVSSNKNNRIG